MEVKPYQVHIPDSVLADLRDRLERTRWPGEIPDSGWDYGSNLGYVKELLDYWVDGFDWRAREEAINALPHFRATVQDLDIHFIHQRGSGPNPLPLLVTHGWPSTFFEMMKIIPLLTDPAGHGGSAEDSFDVVVPSMPGYGFSDKTVEPGVDVSAVAGMWAKLMVEDLGYQRFAAQGGDWGGAVTSKLAFSYPQNVIGIHSTFVYPRLTPYMGPGSRGLSEAEEAHLKQWNDWTASEGGYGHIQGTKPQTLSYGLNDSPAGLAAWIVEKYRTWSDCGGDVESRFSKDILLTTATIYWVTQTINSSTRFYYENRRKPWNLAKDERIDVPCAIAVFPYEINSPPREWAERCYNVQRWTVMPGGGHFAALEEPTRLVEDIRGFFRGLR